MKSALPAALALALLAAGYVAGRGCAGDDTELLALRDTLVTARTAHHRTDSLLAAALVADSLRRAEDSRRVATRRSTAVRLGATVAPLIDSARVLAGACTDSAGIDSLLAAAEAAMAAHLAADSLARVAEDQRHAGDSAMITMLMTVTVPALQAERDTAQARAERAVSLGMARRPGHGWRTDALVLAGGAIAGALLLR